MSARSSTTARLEHLARQEVAFLLEALPPPLRAKALEVPVVLERRPTAAQRDDGVEEDTLGLFVGEPFPESCAGGQDLPPQILLFLESIWDYAEQEECAFREEVRRTMMHELGHYLGLDEDDLRDRDLD